MSLPSPAAIAVTLAGAGVLAIVWTVARKLGRKDGPMNAQDKRQAIELEAQRLGIEPEVARAIIQVESSGSGFAKGPDGRPRLVVRYEPHIFKKYAGQESPANHANQSTEWASFEAARKVNDTAAHLSISMGAGQVMGFNHKRVGYKTPQAMLAAFAHSERAQIQAMFRFIETDAKLLQAARVRDWTAFAVKYNGPAQKGYDNKMAAQYAKFRKEPGKEAVA